MVTELKGGPGGSLNRDVTSIDDTDSPYTTTGEDILLVDTSGGAVTVTLATADATADPESSIRIYDSGENASSNNITVNTEGSENINPGTLSSVTLSVDGTWINLQADGSNWFADLAPEVSSLTADTLTTNTSLTDANANTIADFAGDGLTVDGSNVLNQNVQPVTTNTTTSGSGVYLVDTSDGAKTLNLSTADAGGNASIGVVNVNGSNAVSVDTEGAETIDPGGASSKTLSTEGWLTWFNSDGSDWDASLDADVESVTTDSLIIGGTLYEEDDNSPFQPSGVSSATYTIAGDYDEVIVIPESGQQGFDQFRINAVNDADYRNVALDNTESTGDTEWDISPTSTDRVEYFVIRRWARTDRGLFACHHMDSSGVTVWGRFQAVSTSITSLDSFEVLDSGAANQSMNARVYGRVMSI